MIDSKKTERHEKIKLKNSRELSIIHELLEFDKQLLSALKFFKDAKDIIFNCHLYYHQSKFLKFSVELFEKNNHEKIYRIESTLGEHDCCLFNYSEFSRELDLKDYFPLLEEVYKDLLVNIQHIAQPEKQYIVYVCSICKWLRIGEVQKGMCPECYKESLTNFKKKIPHTNIEGFDAYLLSLGFEREQLNNLDYVNHEKKVAIEVDSEEHYAKEAVDKDKRKDRQAFVDHGVTVLRYPKKMILENMQEVIEQIESALLL